MLTRLLEPVLEPAVLRGDAAEQRAIADYFSGRTGVFVEVGAFEPIVYSQTWALEQAGWTGLLVEPVPAHAAALRTARRARVAEVACVAPEQSGAMLPMTVRGGVSAIGVPIASGAADAAAEAETIRVRGATLDSLLVEHGIAAVDFLSVDVEGMEIDVLRGLSLDRVRPHLILIEDFADDNIRHRFMRSVGYRRVRRTGNNSWYVDAATPFRVSAFGRWQLLRKYHLSRPVRWAKRTLKAARGRAA